MSVRIMKDHQGHVFIEDIQGVVTVPPAYLADLAKLLSQPEEIGYHWAPVQSVEVQS